VQFSSQQGLSLIEILVTLVVTSLGLLGIGVLQARGLQSNQDGYLYSQASALAYDMAERIRVNVPAAVAGNYNTTMSNAPAAADCVSADCTSDAAMAAYDLYDWKQRTVKVLLPDASAAISYSAPNVTITIRWRGFSAGNCDASGGTTSTDYRCFTLTVRPQ
jgi:type IV pilus assembly protein PilV